MEWRMFYSPRNLMRRILDLRLTLSRLDARKHGLLQPTRATEKLDIEWPDKPCDSQSSKLDECFLRGQTNFCPFSEKAAIFQ